MVLRKLDTFTIPELLAAFIEMRARVRRGELKRISQQPTALSDEPNPRTDFLEEELSHHTLPGIRQHGHPRMTAHQTASSYPLTFATVILCLRWQIQYCKALAVETLSARINMQGIPRVALINIERCETFMRRRERRDRGRYPVQNEFWQT